MRVDWLADVLRAAGVDVEEVHGWTLRGNGAIYADAVVLHHDASAPGASPNIPGYIARQVDAGKAGANCWVALDGTWHLIAAGRTYHAGKVLPGKPGNTQAIGVETDHTVGEVWPWAQLNSVRRGVAAVLAHLGQDTSRYEFHKTICSPVGRKQDPDGLFLDTERAAVDALMEDDMPWTEADSANLKALREGMDAIRHEIAGPTDKNPRLVRILRAAEAIKTKLGA